MSIREVISAAMALAALPLLLVSPVSAQLNGGGGEGEGCPWCTTPTTCAGVEEDTPYDLCVYTQAQGCSYPNSERSCTYGGSGSGGGGNGGGNGGGGELAVLVAAAGIENHQIRQVVTERWGKQHLVEVDKDLYAFWSCDGQLLGLVREIDDKPTDYLDPAPYRHVYSIGGLLARRAITAG
jgi:hypothetical protein